MLNKKGLRLKFVAVIAAALCIAGFVVVDHVNAVDQVDFPDPVGYINDFANILNNDDELNAKLEAFDNAESTQVIVITMQSLPENESIYDFIPRLTDSNPKWSAGQEGKDNGVFFTIVVDSHDVAIDTGYGVEGALTDIRCSQILENDVKPYFRDGDFSTGVAKGVDDIIAAVQGEYTAEDTESTQEKSNTAYIFIDIAVVLILIAVIWSFFERRKRGCLGCTPIPIPPTGYRVPSSTRSSRSTWTGGSIGGGFGGGSHGGGFRAGGGSFGGGGSRSKW